MESCKVKNVGKSIGDKIGDISDKIGDIGDKMGDIGDNICDVGDNICDKICDIDKLIADISLTLSYSNPFQCLANGGTCSRYKVFMRTSCTRISPRQWMQNILNCKHQTTTTGKTSLSDTDLVKS